MNEERRKRINLNARNRRYRRMFGEGNRELVLARSDGRCVRCGALATDIHHIDDDGEQSISFASRLDRELGIGIGHDPNRMEALCKSCHSTETAKKQKGKRKRPPGMWSMKHNACIGCGTIERPHVGRGMCKRCYRKSVEKLLDEVIKEIL